MIVRYTLQRLLMLIPVSLSISIVIFLVVLRHSWPDLRTWTAAWPAR